MLVVGKSSHKQINWVKNIVYGSTADFGDLLGKKTRLRAGSRISHTRLVHYSTIGPMGRIVVIWGVASKTP